MASYLANIYCSLQCSSLKLRRFSKIYIFNPRTTFNFPQLEMFVSVTGLNGCSEPQLNSEDAIEFVWLFQKYRIKTTYLLCYIKNILDY